MEASMPGVFTLLRQAAGCRILLVFFCLQVAEGTNPNNGSNISRVWSESLSRVDIALKEASQRREFLQAKREADVQKCQNDSRAHELRKSVIEAEMKIHSVRPEIAQAASASANLTEAIGKLEDSIGRWHRDLTSISRPHDANQTQPKPLAEAEKVWYNAVRQHLASKIDAASKDRVKTTWSIVQSLRERAGKWGALHKAVAERDVGLQNLIGFMSACHQKLAELKAEEQLTAEDLQELQAASQILSAGSTNKEPTRLQTILLQVHAQFSKYLRQSHSLRIKALQEALGKMLKQLPESALLV